MDQTTDFRFGPVVLSWIEALSSLHAEQSELLQLIAEKVRTSSETLLHYGALGLRGVIHQAAENAECTRAFQARADAVLWGLEVLAADESFTLPPDLIAALVETALARPEEELAGIAAIIEIAELTRSPVVAEWTEAQQLILAWAGRTSRGELHGHRSSSACSCSWLRVIRPGDRSTDRTGRVTRG